MDEPGCSLSISSLLCQEDATDLDLELEDELCQAYLLLKDAIFTDEEYIEELASRERSSFERQEDHEFSSCDGCLVPADNWFKRARSDAIRWILNVSPHLLPCPPLFSCSSSFPSTHQSVVDQNGKPWATRLLSTACLSVAAKMEECRVPPLSEMQIEGYAFDSNAVQRMELLLLDTLQWRTNCVTPFDYLSYFRSKFRCEESLHKAIDFIFAAIDGSSLASTFHTRTVDSSNTLNYWHNSDHFLVDAVIDLTTCRSSAVAAAAILAAASSEIYSKELLETKMSTTSLFQSFSEKEHVFSCYSIMTRDLPKNTMTPERLASSEASENYSSITVAIDSAPPSSFSLSGAKRRRLRLPDIH
ncbi:hypothetical protein BHM03_00017464 [Ensete ventricosum]|uniref:Cyclin N-terminal domain-containing protein n=1 Tax=Ensete ventricosum TaxID=4639 RepID=A0A445MEY4_ENSVE|nr:hypothetical protein BHM03_00017464 [Ensete ventricosum]